MLSIQQAGVEILGNNPRSLYFFCGSEYGIKQKYVSHLEQLYGRSVVSVDKLKDLLKSFERKSLVPTPDSVYVCRYDEEFVKEVDTAQAKRVLSYDVPGCVVCFYNDERQFKKLDKLFPDNVVRFDTVSSQYVAKYLKQDYPLLDERYVNLVSDKCEGGYGQAKIVCGQMDSIRDSLQFVEDEELLRTFGMARKYTEEQMMHAAAARSFSGVMSVVDSFEDDLNYLVNGLCHVSIELDKAMDKKGSNSSYSKYVKLWTREDVYNFFEQAYTQTLKMRSTVSCDPYYCIVYLASLLKFKHIPSVSQVG